jgi:nitrite reductase/ring-hydroxylating ferredoxin subunit
MNTPNTHNEPNPITAGNQGSAPAFAPCPCAAQQAEHGAEQSRREFVKGAAILAAAAHLAPSELLSATLLGGDKKRAELADFFTVNFSQFPALQNVGGSIRLNTSTIPGAGGLRNIIITRVGQAEFAAVTEECTHAGCSVGTFSGGALECPCHGSRFDAQGNVLGGPAGSPLTKYDTSFTAGDAFMRVNIPGFTAPAANPAATISATALSFGQVIVGSANVQQYTITASNLTSALTITAPLGAALALAQNGSFGQTLTLQPSSGQIAQTTVFVRFAPTAATTLSGSITHTSGTTNFATVTLSGTGVVPQPSATLSSSTIAFGKVLIGAVAVQSYTVSAINLSSALSVIAPAGLTLSTSENGTYTSSLTLQPTSGQLSQTVFVRFAPTAATTLMAGIQHLAGTTSLAVMQVTASVSPVALTFSVASLEFSGVMTGGAAIRQYQLRGTDIIGTLQVSASQGFTVARQMEGPFQPTLSIMSLANGTLDTPVFVRFAPTQVGATQGEIRHTLGDQTLGTVRVSGTATMTSVADEQSGIVVHAYPNPVMETLFIAVTMESAATVEMKLVNILGQEVMQKREQMPAGRHFSSMQIANLPTGTYTLRVSTGNGMAEKRVVKR